MRQARHFLLYDEDEWHREDLAYVLGVRSSGRYSWAVEECPNPEAVDAVLRGPLYITGAVVVKGRGHAEAIAAIKPFAIPVIYLRPHADDALDGEVAKIAKDKRELVEAMVSIVRNSRYVYYERRSKGLIPSLWGSPSRPEAPKCA